MVEIDVLVVDDEEDFASALTARLTLKGFNAKAVTSGEEALPAIANDPPHVVVLDLKMPDLGGLEVLEGIKSFAPNIEVIILTGHGSVANGIEGMERGAFDYIMKPVDLEEIIVKINEAYEKYKMNISK
ncbi:MAG: response regulator [Desulfobulbaceae bacterium]|uniref:Response regulator n=1 Tax=Candidatus Desulfobia pelagia TaxID=2841692 RepID=A0A8J6NEB7_9BACT|nr:response regulator [Candidatus Desulfobia pelagia]